MEGAVESWVQPPAPSESDSTRPTACIGADNEGGVALIGLLLGVVERVGGWVDRVGRGQLCGMWTGTGAGCADGFGRERGTGCVPPAVNAHGVPRVEGVSRARLLLRVVLVIPRVVAYPLLGVDHGLHRRPRPRVLNFVDLAVAHVWDLLRDELGRAEKDVAFPHHVDVGLRRLEKTVLDPDHFDDLVLPDGVENVDLVLLSIPLEFLTTLSKYQCIHRTC